MNQNLINQVIILFLVIFVGIYSRKKGFLNDKVNKGLSEFLLNVTVPFTILSSFNVKYSKDMLLNALLIFFVTFIIHIVLIIFCKLIFRMTPEDKKSILEFAVIFSNCGFMGFPITMALYGKAGVFYCSIFNIVFNLFCYSYGAALISDSEDSKSIIQVIKNPAIFSVFIGFTIFMLPFKLPQIISSTIDLIASLTTPLSMILIGSMLGECRFRDVFTDIYVYFETAVRLVVVPLAIILVIKIIGADINNIAYQVCIVIEAMPSAANTVVFAEKYDNNSVYASKCVFVSTMFSVITVPLVFLFMH